MPSKDTSIERCKEKMETKASAKDMFRNASIFTDVLFLALIHFIVARVIFVKAYTASASMAIKWNTVPLSFTKARITVPTSEKDSTISIIPVNRTRKHSLRLCR